VYLVGTIIRKKPEILWNDSLPMIYWPKHQKLQAYPETYFLPEEDQALTILLETLEGLFGETISQLPQALRLRLVRDIVHACVAVSHL
jgi:hypothetical protein